MGKHGPCCHCGVTSTPLWRNGPLEKPVLCNACGSRWRTKGSLANYTPLHSREPTDWEEPKFPKVKIIYNRPKTEKLHKRKQINGMVEKRYEIPLSETLDEDNSSGPAISYSESCVHFGNNDASDWTGSTQSNAWDSLVPSKKRSVICSKHSSVEKLTKDLYSIWHEQQSSNLSGTSDDDLLFDDETPIGSVEIGHGGVLLRHPLSKAILEEESEASSLPLYDKLLCDSHSRPAPIEIERTNFSKSSINKLKISTANLAQENGIRDGFSSDILDMLQEQDRDSLLWSADLEGIISFEVFKKHMTDDEKQHLMKYLPSIDTAEATDSLKIMFSSPHFLESLAHFQKLMQDGIFYQHYRKSPPFDKPWLLSLRESESQVIYEDEDNFYSEGTCFSPRSLFTSPPDRSSMLQLG